MSDFCIVIMSRQTYRCFLKFLRMGDHKWDTARPGQSFVDHGIRIFQGLPSLRSLSCFFRITPTSHYNSAMDLRHCTFSIWSSVRNTSKPSSFPSSKHICLDKMLIDLANAAINRPDVKDPTSRWPDLGMALSPCQGRLIDVCF